MSITLVKNSLHFGNCQKYSRVLLKVLDYEVAHVILL